MLVGLGRGSINQISTRGDGGEAMRKNFENSAIIAVALFVLVA